MARPEQYKKKNGATAWKFQLYTGVNPKTGKKSKTTRRGFKTKREATIELRRLQTLVDSGEYFNDGSDGKLTFEEVYDKFYAGYIKTVKPSSATTTKNYFDNQILPAFGNQLINKITTDDIQKQAEVWQQYTNVSRYLSSMNRVLKYALRRGYITKNPMDHVIKPKTKKRQEKKMFYEKKELREFIEIAKEAEPNVYAFFRVLAFGGIRKGEAIALEWPDIDFENRTINIDKTISRTDEGVQLSETKTGLKRKISIDQETLDAIQKIQPNPFNDIIFYNGKFKHITQSQPRKWLLTLLKDKDLKPIHIHAFRHTHASLLFESGATAKEVQERLGHEKIQTTLDIYTHVTQKSRDNFAEKFAEYVDF